MDDIKYEQFGRDFIGHLRDRGLGNIPKRELDVLILQPIGAPFLARCAVERPGRSRASGA
jgi:hypothetical protein